MNLQTVGLWVVRLAFSAVWGGSVQVVAGAPINLGTAGKFAVLAGSTITNTGPTFIKGGDVGVSPGSAITGFGSVVGPYSTHLNDGVALLAQDDLKTAYDAAAGQAYTENLTGVDLGGLTLLPGTFFFSSSAQLTGMLTLDTLGNPDAQFLFQIGSTLTTASNSSVVSLGSLAPLCDVFWQVGSSATLGTDTEFQGHILAQTSITLTTGATIIDGSALARNGAVTLDTNVIDNSVCHTGSVPDARSSLFLFGFAVGGLFLLRKRTSFAF